MSEWSIQLSPLTEYAPEEPCRIRIEAGGIPLTKLLRQPGSQADDAVVASPDKLAFWFCDNWWRLRWETRPNTGPTPGWRLAHELASVGGGFAWPQLAIWGDVDRVGLLARADPVGVVGPVRYLTDAIFFIKASSFEDEVDNFLDRVADETTGFGSDRAALGALIAALRAERGDPEIALWRRLEARLGYDPDQAHDAVIEAAAALAGTHGLEAVEEAVAAEPDAQAPERLAAQIEHARSRGQVCDFSGVLAAVQAPPHNPPEPPWLAAEVTAARVRTLGGITPGPIPTRRLAEILGTTAYSFRNTPREEDRAYGLRLHAGRGGQQRVSLRTRSPRGRRFELCRALGDALWSPEEQLGPMTPTTTARQKFQRAFAQALLCPAEDVRAFLATEDPTPDDISAAADHFAVNESVIRTLAVNKGWIGREQLQDRLEAA